MKPIVWKLMGAALAIGLVALLVSSSAAGCNNPGPKPKPLAQLTPQENNGHVSYVRRCAACHGDRTNSSLQGPPLLGVFKRQYLPSGMPANDDRVTGTILHGRGMMPPQRDITDDELTDLLAYMHTL